MSGKESDDGPDLESNDFIPRSSSSMAILDIHSVVEINSVNNEALLENLSSELKQRMSEQNEFFVNLLIKQKEFVSNLEDRILQQEALNKQHEHRMVQQEAKNKQQAQTLEEHKALNEEQAQLIEELNKQQAQIIEEHKAKNEQQAQTLEEHKKNLKDVQMLKEITNQNTMVVQRLLSEQMTRNLRLFSKWFHAFSPFACLPSRQSRSLTRLSKKTT